MDEAGRLVSELHNKLAELDLRVWNYRRDMAAEFARYAEDLLRTVPQEISETVSKTIAQDLSNYKSLNPDPPVPVTSGAAGSEVRQSCAAPCLTDQTTSSAYNDMTRDPEQDSPQVLHEREHEFQGLFTPSYLPLLDYTSRQVRASPLHSPISFDKGKGNEMEDEQDEKTHVAILEDAPAFERPSQPVRRSTDELSIGSDRSDRQTRRSALRRSSDNSKLQIPRRVRFDVMGEEVLPTASPQRAEIAIENVAFYLADDDKPGTEQTEEAQDSPPHKKVSTTDALRALSRQPLEDDGAQWITVSSGLDGEPVELDSGEGALKSNSELNIAPNASPKQTLRNAEDNDDDDTVSDDGMANMPPLSPMRGKRANPVQVSSPTDAHPEAEKAAESSTPPSKSPSNLKSPEKTQGGDEEDLTFLEDDEDNLFRFDESGYEEKMPQEDKHEESDSDSDSVLEMPSSRQSPADHGFSASPALNIPSRKTPPCPSAPKPSVGSYKGHPFNLPIVSEELHAQAASLGAVHSFVGSVTGRTGLDPGNDQSFRESLKTGSFMGTPRSMVERMMMEDLIAAEKEKEKAEEAEKAKKSG
jgi:hypothetical protein